jgi:choline dehydrogenase-like flavoprotein
MAIKTESTSFTKDIQGRYLCNTYGEATAGGPFDIVIIGGGTFGAAIAEHFWYRQKRAGGGLRTIVLEAGPFTLPEHVQNTGILGLFDPADSVILNENNPQPEPARNEVWGVPWKSATPFKGLAYCVGGRSLYWGGWSPRLLDAEVSTWPPEVVADLKSVYFDESTKQIGVDDTNDFIFGELHNALRRQLFDNLGTVAAAIPLAELPQSPLFKPGTDTAQLLGLDSTSGLSPDDLLNMLKLEAPLAVQARAPHAGFFPLNKFSTVPLLMKAARTAFADNGDDAKKEFMLLPNTHVLTLRTVRNGDTWRVTRVETSQGPIDLAPDGVAIIALGTIESARLGLVTFDGSSLPTLPRIGKNLMAHLRSNLTFRIPRIAIPGLSTAVKELQTSALFVKGRAMKGGTLLGHFHLQITASGGASTVGSEDELFRKVPDIDFYEALQTSTDTHVAIAIRGIGQMSPDDLANPDPSHSNVALDGVLRDEYGVRRARVTMAKSQTDLDLAAAMEAAMVQVAQLFGAPASVTPVPDGLGTTHHETGTLSMGTDPAASVTDGDGRFHHTDNLYAAGPSLFPTIGSPNPMLTGIALARRTGDRIINPPPFVATAGFQSLVDSALTDWKMSTIRNQPGRDNPGSFVLRRGALEARPGTDIGLFWYTKPAPPRFVLRLDWMMTANDDNSGIFICFPDPESKGYDNSAYVAVNFGFEVQIDEQARPDGSPIHRTGAIYTFQGPDLTRLSVRAVGEWNAYEIMADGTDITVSLNGQLVNQFHFAGDPQSPTRGQGSFIGLQTHTGRVRFRNLQWKAV